MTFLIVIWSVPVTIGCCTQSDSRRIAFWSAGGSDEVSSTEEVRQPIQRVASGAVRSLKDTFSEVERDYEDLKRQIASGALPVELDPGLVDPFADQDLTAVEALKTSFREHGQEMPFLVRVHPQTSGRYQIAYGHRRLRAASELAMTVKAPFPQVGR